jgi:hypothetical protein
MATADPIPNIDMTPYGCDCCGADCFCVTCTGDRCPDRLCAIFEGAGFDTDPANKIVRRTSLTAVPDSLYPGPGWYSTPISGDPFNVSVVCYAGYLRVYVQYGYTNPFNGTQLWAAEYHVDVPVDECEELLTPLDLTLDLDTVLVDTHPTSSPPATVRVILSDPNVLGHPGEEDARNACCHNTESDYLCSRDAPADLPATLAVTVTSTVLNGPDPWGSGAITASVYSLVYPTGYCWTAEYRSDPVVWAGCSDEIGAIELLSYVVVQVQGSYFPHRHYPNFAYPPPGTALLQASAVLAYRLVGDTGYGTVISSTGGTGTPPSQGASGLLRVPCEDFSATVVPPLFSTVFPGASWWVLPYDPPFAHYTAPECTGGVGLSGYVTSITVAE